MLKVNQKIFRSLYGGSLYKYLDIRKTIHSFSKINLRMKLWRTHTYLQSGAAYEILRKHGVEIVSDRTRAKLEKIYENGMIYIPITALNDDRILSIYCDRGNQIEMQYEWKRVSEDIRGRIKRKEDMVILLHPLIMKIYDDFKSFELLIKQFSGNDYHFVTMSELAEKATLNQTADE